MTYPAFVAEHLLTSSNPHVDPHKDMEMKKFFFVNKKSLWNPNQMFGDATLI